MSKLLTQRINVFFYDVCQLITYILIVSLLFCYCTNLLTRFRLCKDFFVSYKTSAISLIKMKQKYNRRMKQYLFLYYCYCECVLFHICIHDTGVCVLLTSCMQYERHMFLSQSNCIVDRKGYESSEIC